MLAINFNSRTPFHIDLNDNSLYTVVPVSNWTDGNLIIPHLGISIELVKEQIVMFRSNLLIHGNDSFAKGVRFSMVFFSHKNTFKN